VLWIYRARESKGWIWRDFHLTIYHHGILWKGRAVWLHNPELTAASRSSKMGFCTNFGRIGVQSFFGNFSLRCEAWKYFLGWGFVTKIRRFWICNYVRSSNYRKSRNNRLYPPRAPQRRTHQEPPLWLLGPCHHPLRPHLWPSPLRTRLWDLQEIPDAQEWPVWQVLENQLPTELWDFWGFEGSFDEYASS